jgi:hypothetical protein
MFALKKIILAFVAAFTIIAIFCIFTNYFFIKRMQKIQKNYIETVIQFDTNVLNTEIEKIIKINNDTYTEINKIKIFTFIFAASLELLLLIIIIFGFKNFYYIKYRKDDENDDIKLENNFEIKSNALADSLKEISGIIPKNIWNKIAEELNLITNSFLQSYPPSTPLSKIYNNMESEILNKIKDIDMETYEIFISIYKKSRDFQ